MNRSKYKSINLAICLLSVFMISAKTSKHFSNSKNFLVKEIKAYADSTEQPKRKSVSWQRKNNQMFNKRLDEFIKFFPFKGQCDEVTIISGLDPEDYTLTESILSDCAGWNEIINTLTEETGIQFSEFYPTHIRLINEKKSQILKEKEALLKIQIGQMKDETEKYFSQYLNTQLVQLNTHTRRKDFCEFIGQIITSDEEYLKHQDPDQIEQYLPSRRSRIMEEKESITRSIWLVFVSSYKQRSRAYLYNLKKAEEKLEKSTLNHIRSGLTFIISEMLDPTRLLLEERIRELHRATEYRAATAYLNKTLKIESNSADCLNSDINIASDKCFRCNEDSDECESTLIQPFRCLHSLCINCLQDLIELKDSEKEPLLCPMLGCSAPAKFDELLANGLISILTQARFNFFGARKIASISPNWLACKKADCEGGILKSQGSKNTRYTCELCNHNQCMNCSEDHNKFISCEEYQEMLNHANDPLYLSRIKGLIKDCPNCKIPISKCEGCLHMTCKRCKHEFNWETLKTWQGTRWYESQDGTNINPDVDTGRENSQIIN